MRLPAGALRLIAVLVCLAVLAAAFGPFDTAWLLAPDAAWTLTLQAAEDIPRGVRPTQPTPPALAAPSRAPPSRG